MSATPAIVTTIASFAVTAGVGVTAFVKQAKKYESDLFGYINEFNKYLNELSVVVKSIDSKVSALTPPAPAKAVAKKAKAPAPAKRLR
jgi:hypothetical protein